MTRALRDIPAVRALAEREARAAHEAWQSVYTGPPARRPYGWDDLFPPARADSIATHLALLCDLTRPASRDAVARLVAEAVGLVCGPFAPRFAHTPVGPGVESDMGGWWTMWAKEGVYFWERRHTGLARGVVVPGIASTADPAEALAIIADAVLP